MRGMGSTPDEPCPIQLNFDPATFKPGDLVSYRVPEAFGDSPFVGEIVKVEEDYILLKHYNPDDRPDNAPIVKGTRESRPIVGQDEACGDQKV